MERHQTSSQQFRVIATMTSFSATCSRLRQYLREQQRLASVAQPTRTMSLLSKLDVSAETEAETCGVALDRQPLDLFPQHPSLSAAVPAEEEKSQLSISYGGQMVVFHDFPADKAGDLMLMAEKMSSVDPPDSIGGTTGLPLKRRASLHGFMEKRRERINTSRRPYQMDFIIREASGWPAMVSGELPSRIKLGRCR